ncbi:MAG: ABC transporter ATP-binding protein [Gammaproteobacteria bacterium]|nr:ABC transporter ATP-binding protein [Gammaproteobacteria bacterium]
MTNEVLLEARGLVRRYGRHVALAGIDLVLRRGEVLGFLGLNGAGKSTTLQILAGALAPHAGRAAIAGHDLARHPRAARAALGYLPQVPPVIDDIRVDEYLELCARLQGVDRSARPAALARARARCGLDDVGARLVRHLSQGYRQRLGLAQAIVHDPAVLLLDEPTTGLDPVQIRDVRALVADLGRDHAVIVSSHILSEVRALASRVVILHAGRIVHDGDNRATGSVCLRTARPLDPAALPAAMAPVALPDGRWLVSGIGDEDDVAALASAVVGSGAGLTELVRDADDLERLFMQLTAGAAA